MTSVYIHIPFCSNICSYCDFCKFIYNKKWVTQYLNELEKEINEKYQNEVVSTIYIGGGTPSILSIDELKKLFSIIEKIKKNRDFEFTFECNVESLDYEKLKILFDNEVNRLSIGVQTFNEKYLKFLNRNHNKEEIISKIEMSKKIGFENINIDLIYGLKNQNIEDLKQDLNDYLKLDINHISTYSLIIEPHTKLYIDNEQNIDEDLDFKMYELICNTLKENGFNHYEISNFAKTNYESKHNLVYWNNLEYYGFGVGASGYINGKRYDNTRNLQKYLKGEYLDNINKLSLNEKIENEFILGFRKINGININEFYKKYKFDVLNIDIIKKLINENKIINEKENIFINPKYIYIQNEILVDFMGENYEWQINSN